MVHVEVTTRGVVSHRATQQAREKLREVQRYVKGPILSARVTLIQEANPRIPLPARAEAELNLQGRRIRARAAAPSMHAALDEVTERMRHNLRRYVDRLMARAREPVAAPAGDRSPPERWRSDDHAPQPH